MTTVEQNRAAGQASAAAQARRAAWYDRVVVERALQAWAFGEPVDDRTGRPLTGAERLAVYDALLAVGETRTAALRFLRVSTATMRQQAARIAAFTGGVHRRRVATAVRHLDALDARTRIAVRQHPFSTAESYRMLAASTRGAAGGPHAPLAAADPNPSFT